MLSEMSYGRIVVSGRRFGVRYLGAWALVEFGCA